MGRTSRPVARRTARLLSAFQEEIARLLASLPEAEGFALAGGAALIADGVVARHTADLDFFGQESDAVDHLGPAVEAAATAVGIAVEWLRRSPGFGRLELTRGAERCEVDIGFDARLWPVRQTSLGPAIGELEMAADKTLALFGRAAARDYLDVALAAIYGEQRLLELAAAKDLGFSAAHLGEALAAFDRLGREQFDLDDLAYRALRDWSHRWSGELHDAAQPSKGPSPEA